MRNTLQLSIQWTLRLLAWNHLRVIDSNLKPEHIGDDNKWPLNSNIELLCKHAWNCCFQIINWSILENYFQKINNFFKRQARCIWWILYSRGRFWVHHMSLSSGHRQINISAVADPVFLFVDICKWVDRNSATAEWTFLPWPLVKKQPKNDIFPNFPQINAFLQQNILCYLFNNGSRPIYYC